MNKKNLIFVIAAAVIILGTTAGIFYLRGFRLDINQRSLARTGLLVVDSTPDGAKVFLDGRLTSATDTTITFLTPKKYHLKLVKEGYTTWEKEVEIKADLTTEAKAILFPAIPDLTPLTLTGAINPVLSPDGGKIVYAVPVGEKSGLWVIDIVSRPLGIGGGLTQIVKNTSELDFSKAKFSWSPDSAQILVQFESNEKSEISRNYLLAANKLNTDLADVTATLPAISASWQQEINLKEQARILRLRKDLPELASQSSALLDKALKAATASAVFLPTLAPDNLFWSPDDTKFFSPKSQDIKNQFKLGVTVYRVRDPNPLKVTPAKFEIPAAANILWFPSSEHLILAEDGKIAIVEYEGTNKVTIFTGAFENNFVIPYPAGTKLVILTNFNQEAGTLLNLYTINLK